jgi:hypothetical protein
MADDRARTIRRRAILTGLLLGAAGTAVGATMSGCTASRQSGDQPRAAASRRSGDRQSVLLAYFSRAGENYYNGGRRRLTVSNTQALAQMISGLIGCDLYRIEAADPYSDDYDPTVERNVREQRADARPAIANPLASIERYDDPPLHHVRDERPGQHLTRLRRVLSRSDSRRRSRRARRRRQRRRPGRRVVATPHRPNHPMTTDRNP